MNDNSKNYPQNYAEDEKKNAGKKTCPVCGAELPETAEFCTKCGAKLTDDVEIIDEPITILYAGPEFFAKRRQAIDTPMEDVYGGPEPDEPDLIGTIKDKLRK